MELKKDKNNYYQNKLDENFLLEDNYVYPLIKSSDLKSNYITTSDKYVIVPQKFIRENTLHIEEDAPQTWEYLKLHEELFNKRKSSIYKNCPPFSIFGIGDYSFCKYKVAISGFYKNPNFVLLDNDKPIMLDDTCYFVGFNNLKEAYITMVLLNSNTVNEFLSSVAFLDKKRPYTKEILMRIDMKKLTADINYNDFCMMTNNYDIKININRDEYKEYINKFNYKTI